MSIQPIETHYNGYRFRSRLEARWAVFFDTLGVIYEYEREGYKLPSGTNYLPDFDVVELGVFLEIKPDAVTDAEKQKCKELAAVTGQDVILVAGLPSFPKQNAIRYSPNGDERSGCFGWCRRGKHLCFYTCDGTINSYYHSWDCFLYPDPNDQCGERSPVSMGILETAQNLAKAARFEFGEKG